MCRSRRMRRGAAPLLAMEIDYGPFERELQSPAEVEIEEVHGEQHNGLF